MNVNGQVSPGRREQASFLALVLFWRSRLGVKDGGGLAYYYYTTTTSTSTTLLYYYSATSILYYYGSECLASPLNASLPRNLVCSPRRAGQGGRTSDAAARHTYIAESRSSGGKSGSGACARARLARGAATGGACGKACWAGAKQAMLCGRRRVFVMASPALEQQGARRTRHVVVAAALRRLASVLLVLLLTPLGEVHLRWQHQYRRGLPPQFRRGCRRRPASVRRRGLGGGSSPVDSVSSTR